MSKTGLTRRDILEMAGVGAGSLLMPSILRPCFAGPGKRRREVRFGICADVHKDVIHDADKRLRIFIDTMNSCH
jgi:hypothetical protein